MNIHVHCPHCKNPIELVELQPKQEITCTACGSSFHLEEMPTTSWTPGGTVVGRFEILEEVGHGGFGTVYKARDPQLDRTVAIKVPRRSNIGDKPQDLDRFIREARSVAQLKHASIVAIHEVGTLPPSPGTPGEGPGVRDTPYLVSDFVEGVTLADLLTARRPAPREAAKLIAEVAEALHYAHSQGVVHRDVKPSNIMIRPDGSPVVMDFGLAKRDAGEITMTMDGEVLGTPAYMSPEQARGEAHKVDGRSDVYSLGVILYQLLTGELPFRGNKRMLLYQVMHEEPRAPRSFNDHIPRDLQTITLKSMAKEPGKRYGNAQAMTDDLRRFLRGEPINARPVGQAERLWRWCRRKPALAITGAAALVGGVVALATFVIAFFLVRESRNKAVESATKEGEQRIKAEKLAEANKALALEQVMLRIQADNDRKEAEKATLRSRFDHVYFKSREDPALAILWTIPLLTEALKLDDRALHDSLLMHAGAWSGELHQLQAICAHRWLQCAAISPDGRTVLTGSKDHTARLWDVGTGKPIGNPLQHRHVVLRVAFSPDGKTAITGSEDQTARLWEASTGIPNGAPLQHQDAILSVAFSPNGSMVLTASRDGTARLWDAVTTKPLGLPMRHEGAVGTAVFSQDGKLVLTGSRDNTARLWDVSGKPFGPPLSHKGTVYSVAFSPDSKTVLTGSKDHTAQLWEVATGKPIGAPMSHTSEVGQVAFNANGKIVLTLSDGVRYWDALSGAALASPFPDRLSPRAISFSPDGNLLLTGGFKTVQLWDSANGKPVGSQLQHQSATIAVAFSRDGRILMTAGHDNTARVWEVGTGTSLLHRASIENAAFSPDGSKIVTGGNDQTARLWDATSGRELCPPLRQQKNVLAVSFSPDCKTVLTAGWDNRVRLWDATSGKPLSRFLEHDSPVTAVAFSPNGRMILTFSTKTYKGGTVNKLNAIRLWDAGTYEPLGSPLVNQLLLVGAPFSPDSKILVTADEKARTGRLWDTATGKLVGEILAHKNYLYSVAHSPINKTILTTAQGDSARLWDATTGMPIAPAFPESVIPGVAAFSPDGKTVLTGGHPDNTARLWDAALGSPAGSMMHQGCVLAVAYNPDSKSAATGSEDKTARVWDVAKTALIGPPLHHQAAVTSVAFDRDGKRLFTSAGKMVRCWEWESGRVLGAELAHQAFVNKLILSPNGNSILTRDDNGSAWLWQVPQKHGDPERMLLWAQTITGLELDEHGATRVLDAGTWEKRRQRLQDLGG